MAEMLWCILFSKKPCSKPDWLTNLKLLGYSPLLHAALRDWPIHKWVYVALGLTPLRSHRTFLQVNGQREDDRRVVLSSDSGERLQVAELQCAGL